MKRASAGQTRVCSLFIYPAVLASSGLNSDYVLGLAPGRPSAGSFSTWWWLWVSCGALFTFLPHLKIVSGRKGELERKVSTFEVLCYKFAYLLSFKVKLLHLLSATPHVLADRGLGLTFRVVMGQVRLGGGRAVSVVWVLRLSQWAGEENHLLHSIDFFIVCCTRHAGGTHGTHTFSPFYLQSRQLRKTARVLFCFTHIIFLKRCDALK